jgi:hypothetical protein
MAYRENVSALAELRGISNNPGLREEDIGTGGLHFYDDRGGRTRVISTRMNRASRLFFQHYREKSNSPERWVISGKEFQELKAQAATFFAELWYDNVTPRQLLDAFKEADSVVLFRKSSSSWFLDFVRGLELEYPLKKERELTDVDRALIFEVLGKKYSCDHHDEIRNALAGWLGLSIMQVAILAEQQHQKHILGK